MKQLAVDHVDADWYGIVGKQVLLQFYGEFKGGEFISGLDN